MSALLELTQQVPVWGLEPLPASELPVFFPVFWVWSFYSCQKAKETFTPHRLSPSQAHTCTLYPHVACFLLVSCPAEHQARRVGAP